MAIATNYAHHGFIKLPPDSTGKSMQTFTHLHLDYNTGTVPFISGDVITGSTSGAEATVYEVHGTTSEGTMVVMVSDDSLTGDFTVGENIQVDGTTQAKVEATTQLHAQASVVVGSNNPHYGQRIGPRGAALVRFTAGEQQLDAFGLSRQSTPTQMAQYMFQYNERADEFYDETNGAGSSISHLIDESRVALDVGTVSGEYTRRTTHRYHLYQAGYPTLTEMTVTVGDTGKTNVTRRWGYFDETDGCFFELDGTSLYVVLRSSTDGTATDTRVLQDDWNGDRVNGAGGSVNLSNMTLDLATINLYWIDVQWLGAGKVRFGIYDTPSDRITLHSFLNANTITTPYFYIISH